MNQDGITIQSSSIYSTKKNSVQTIKIKSRTKEKLELMIHPESLNHFQIHMSDSSSLQLDISIKKNRLEPVVIECYLSKGSILNINEMYDKDGVVDLSVHLTEPYSNVQIHTRVDGSQQIRTQLTQQIIHTASYTEANVDSRAIVDNSSKVSIDTTLQVQRQAKNCVSYQNMAGLQLSPGSRIKAVPKLEIHNAEVMTRHGVGIRTVQPEEIWYLTTKGIAKEEAVHIIKKGFIQ